jgi:4-amino-4-deoxy-L-arabinose transferase-like glycosyltransferase
VDRPQGPVNKHWGLIGVILAFLGVRLLYPVLFVPPINFVDPEDLVRGTLAHDVIRGGLSVPFWDYLADHYSGGSLVVGLLAVPSFLLLGPSLFALRLIPILFALAVLLAWYAFMARNFDARAALFTAAFFALPPASYLDGSSLAMGFHTESMVFSAVAFLLLFEMLRREDRGLGWPAGLGLTLGFGTWFCYTTLVSVAIVLVWWFWHDRRFVVRTSFALFLGLFALGFAPWVPANVSHHFRGLEFLWDGLGYDYVKGLPETGWRIVKTALWCLPTMFVHDPVHGTRALGWPVVYSALFGAALLWVVSDDRRAGIATTPPPARFFASACVVYVIVVSLTRYGLEPYGSMYLAPMLPFFFCAAGLSLARLWKREGWSRAAAAGVLAIAMIGGGLGLSSRLDFRWPGASFTMPGYSYAQLADAIELRHPHDYPYYASLLPRAEHTLTSGERTEFLRHLWWPNGYKIERPAIVAEARRFASFPEPARALGQLQLGIVLLTPLVGADDAQIARLSREYPWISEGVRLDRVSRRLALRGIPVVDRLPLALDPDTRILFMDPGTHDSPDEVGWVKGEEQATLLIESTRALSSVRVRLTNGDRGNWATLASDRGERSIALAAGQSLVDFLDLGPGVPFDGRYYWKISVGSRYGHFPILTRREPDTRYLGVHVTIRLASAGAGVRPQSIERIVGGHPFESRRALAASQARRPIPRSHEILLERVANPPAQSPREVETVGGGHHG